MLESKCEDIGSCYFACSPELRFRSYHLMSTFSLMMRIKHVDTKGQDFGEGCSLPSFGDPVSWAGERKKLALLKVEKKNRPLYGT